MHPNAVDWIALGFVVVSALGGMRRGLVVSALSLAGMAAGAYAGSRVAPHVLSGGSSSPWTAVAGLVGAVLGAVLLQALASVAGSVVRGGLRLTPFRLFDSLGGLVLGAATGVVLVWVVGAAALLVPGQSRLRREVQRSAVVHRLDEAVPPKHLLHLLARIDPFPSIAGPAPPSEPPTPQIVGDAAVRRAAGSVVRVLGTACGVGVEGSGWFARSDLVVTAAHVVAGESDTGVEIPGNPRAPSRRRRRVRPARRRRRPPRARRHRAAAAARRSAVRRVGRARRLSRRTGRSSASPGASDIPRSRSHRTRTATGRSNARSRRSRGRSGTATRAARRSMRTGRCRRRSSRRASARPGATACRRPSCAACSTPQARQRSRPAPARPADRGQAGSRRRSSACGTAP